jgi:hypothetical protein
MRALMAQYADRPMGFAGATLVHVAARERLRLNPDRRSRRLRNLPAPRLQTVRNPPAPDEKPASTATMMAEEPKRTAPSKP